MEKYKRLKFRGKRINKLCFIAILVLFIGVGYALIPTSLGVTSTVKIKKSWDLYIDNVSIQSGSVTSEKPGLSTNDKDYSLSFSAQLEKLSDYYAVDMEIVNDGEVNAKIYDLSLNILPEARAKYYKLELYHYGTNTLVAKDDSIPSHDKIKVTLKFQFTDDETINLSEAIGKDYFSEDRSVRVVVNMAFRQV